MNALTNGQNGSTSRPRARVFQSKPDQSIGESATLEALVDLGVDERN